MGNLLYSILISGVWVSFLVIAYTGLVVTIPRAGGDYVWQSRILGSGVGFVMAATGWWFILWLWAPIYGTVLSEEFFQPIFATLGTPEPGGLVRHPQRDLRGHPDHDRAGRHAGLDRYGGLRQGAEVVLLRRPARLRGHRHPAPGHQPHQLRLLVQPAGRTSCSASTTPTQPRNAAAAKAGYVAPTFGGGTFGPEHAAGAAHDVLPAVAELGHHPVRRDPRGQRLPPGVQRHVHRAVDHRAAVGRVPAAVRQDVRLVVLPERQRAARTGSARPCCRSSRTR